MAVGSPVRARIPQRGASGGAPSGGGRVSVKGRDAGGRGAPVSNPASAGPWIITSTPQVIISAPPVSTTVGPVGQLIITATSGVFYLGGPYVTASTGAPVTGPVVIPVFSGDVLYAASPGGDVTASILPGGL